MRRVVLYHADACHLCEEARAVIRSVRAEIPFELSEVDIASDEHLEAAYRERIPVVAVDGEEVFTYVVDGAALRLLVTAPGDA